MQNQPPHRREHRNISLLQLLPYIARFPVTAWVSLLHRVSGVVMFLLLPAILWAFDASVSSELSFAKLKGVFEEGAGVVPGWFFKLLVLAVLWSFIHHLVAGLRFVVLDVNHHAVDRKRAPRSARWVFYISVPLTLVLAAKLFGLY